MAVLFLCLMAIQDAKQNIKDLTTECRSEKEDAPIASKYLDRYMVNCFSFYKHAPSITHLCAKLGGHCWPNAKCNAISR